MTAVEVSFSYGITPDEAVMEGIDDIREVYGIRRLRFSDAARTVTVEYDATRMNEATVANLLRRAGLDVREKLVPATELPADGNTPA